MGLATSAYASEHHRNALSCRIGRARSGAIWPASAYRSSAASTGIPGATPRPVRCTGRRSAWVRSMYDITLSDGARPRERAPTRRYAPSQVFRACPLASCRSGCSVYSWLGRAPVANRRVQQPGRTVGTAHRDRNPVVEVQPAERGRCAHRHRRRWRGIHRRAGDWARRTGHQPGDRRMSRPS